MQVVKIQASPKIVGAPQGRRKAGSRSEAAGVLSSQCPHLLLGILYLCCQPLDHAVQVVELILGSAKILALLGHCGLHLLTLRVRRQTHGNYQSPSGWRVCWEVTDPSQPRLASLVFCNSPISFPSSDPGTAATAPLSAWVHFSEKL